MTEHFLWELRCCSYFKVMKKVELSAVFLCKAQDAALKLTTLNFQSAVLFVQRVSPQIHHAGRCRRDSESEGEQKGVDLVLNSGQLLKWRMLRINVLRSSLLLIGLKKKTSCR